MKRALSIAGQTILLLLTAVTGMLARPFRLTHVLSQQGYMRRQYEFDWLLSAGIAYAVFLLIGFITRRIRTSWLNTTIALVLTLLIVVLFTKVGYKDINLLYSN